MPEFATFKPTYKPLPLETFAETGRQMQERYYQNRDAADKLFSAISNSNTFDQDRQVVETALSDIDAAMSSIGGEYDKAGNVIRDIVKRLDGDKVLKAAVQDKTQYDGLLKTLQEKALDPKSGITQDSISAFAFYTKNSKQGSVYEDKDTGVIKNRINLSAPPPKIDVHQEVMDVIKLRSQNPNSYNQLIGDLYNSQYLQTTDVKQVTPQMLQDAVTAMINSKPEVREYYEYVNNAKVLQKYGNMAVPLEDFNTAFGIKVDSLVGRTDNFMRDEKGNVINEKKIINGKTVEVPVELKGDLNDLFQAFSRNKEGKFDISKFAENSKSLYADLLTNLELNKHVDFAKTFAYMQTDTKLEWNKLAEERRNNERQKGQIVAQFKDNTVAIPIEHLDVKLQEANTNKSKAMVEDLNSKLNALLEKRKTNPSSVNPQEVTQLQNDLTKAKSRYNWDNIILHNINKQGLEDPVVKNIIEDKYNEIVKTMDRYLTGVKDKNKFYPTIDEVKDWLIGDKPLPKLTLLSNVMTDAEINKHYKFTDEQILEFRSLFHNDIQGQLQNIKSAFQDKTQEQIKKNGLKGVYGTAITYVEEKDGKHQVSSINNLIADLILRNSTSYNVVQTAGDEVYAKLDKQLEELGVKNINNYDLSARTIIGQKGVPMGYDITVTPKSGTDGKPQSLIIYGDPEHEKANALAIANLVMSNTKSPEIINSAIKQVAQAYYGSQFDELETFEYNFKNIEPKQIEGVPIRTTAGINNDGIIHVEKLSDGSAIVAYPVINGKVQRTMEYARSYTNIRDLIENIAKTTFNLNITN